MEVDEDKAEQDADLLKASDWPPELIYLAAYHRWIAKVEPVTIRLTYGPEYTIRDIMFSHDNPQWVQCVRESDGRYFEVRASHISYVVCSLRTTEEYRGGG